jgi:non-heme chloroperoxidase
VLIRIATAEEKRSMSESTDTIRRNLVMVTPLLIPGVMTLSSALAATSRSSPYEVSPQHALPYRPFRVKSTDGVMIAGQEWGIPDGPEIVLIHGVLQSHLAFERQVNGDLAKSFRIVTYDLRGHGDSDKPIGNEYYQDGGLWADDLAAVVDGASLKRPVLVGWSLGGLSIANYLVKFGDANLAGLNFVDALTKRAKEFAGWPENRSLLPATASADLATRVNALRGFLRACFQVQPNQEEFERMLAYNAQVPPHVIASIMTGITLNAEEAYKALKVPVLVTHGQKDGLINIRITDYDGSVMPHARVSKYDDVGHSPFFEYAGRFNRELAEFVMSAR